MMKSKRYVLHTPDRVRNIEITKQPDESGGEGNIWYFTHPQYHECAIKIYINQDKANKNRDKILYMMSHPIKISASLSESIRICQPLGYLIDRDTNQFSGFLMRKAFEGSRDLKILDTYYLDSSIRDSFPDDYSWHDKFELDSEKGFKNRLTLLYNWATAVAIMHSQGYVLGDIKPDNVMATASGQISIIDIDSVQIITPDNQFYESGSHTVDYFPYECYSLMKARMPLPESCDSFSIGVCFYSILIGTHPYANVRLLPPFAGNPRYANLRGRIEAGLYYRGENAKFVELLSNHNLHSRFDQLPKMLQILFDRTFRNSLSRPSMIEWRKAIRDILT